MQAKRRAEVRSAREAVPAIVEEPIVAPPPVLPPISIVHQPHEYQPKSETQKKASKPRVAKPVPPAASESGEESEGDTPFTSYKDEYYRMKCARLLRDEDLREAEQRELREQQRAQAAYTRAPPQVHKFDIARKSIADAARRKIDEAALRAVFPMM
jgi:hypothetical protein